MLLLLALKKVVPSVFHVIIQSSWQILSVKERERSYWLTQIEQSRKTQEYKWNQASVEQGLSDCL